jgi:hypothetical protein
MKIDNSMLFSGHAILSKPATGIAAKSQITNFKSQINSNNSNSNSQTIPSAQRQLGQCGFRSLGFGI